MKNRAYGRYLSEAYDALNGDIEYHTWADFYFDCFQKYASLPLKHVCEMACGTGNMAMEFAKKGCHVTAFDLSDTMLTLADKKARDAGVQNIRFTRQDMCDFKVYSKAEMVVCMMDSLNCLLSADEVEAAFTSAYKALEDGGLFIFDVNTKHKYESVYAENAYILEDQSVLLAWQNFYKPSTKKCDLYLTFFFEESDGRYARYDEEMKQRCYPLRSLKKLLEKVGFTVCGTVSDFEFSPVDEKKDDRAWFICKK